MNAPRSHRPLWQTHLLVLAGYLILAVGATWPLATRILTHVPGDGIDDPALAWNLWWIKARLVDQASAQIFAADWMFHPLGINLAFYTLTPLSGLLSVPLQSGLSLVLANNLLLWLHFVLAGYGTFLLTGSLLGSWTGTRTNRWIPFLAGGVYAFASAKLFYASLGQFNIAGSHWIPFCVLYLLRLAEQGRRGRVDLHAALFAGLFFGFQAWVELTYASFLLIFAAVLFLWALLSPAVADRRPDVAPTGSWVAVRAVLLAFAAAGLVMVVTLIPFLAAMVPDLLQEGDFFASGGGFADVFSADLAGYLVPTRLHPWLGSWVAGLPFPNDKGQHIFLGYSVVLLSVIGLVALLRRPARRREGWLWLTLLLLFWLLTLGPTIRVLGNDTAVPGAFDLVSRLPFFSGNRYPSRYSVMLLLCASVTAAYGLERLRSRVVGRRGAGAPAALLTAFALLFVIEHLSVPLPLTDFRVPAIYARMDAQDVSPEGALLELPTGWRNGARVLGKSDVLIMMQQWYQTEHGYRRLGGNTSRNPAYTFQYFTDAPVIGDLIALMNSDDARIGQQVDAEWDAIATRGEEHAAAVLDFLDIAAVSLHVESSPARLVRYVEEILPVVPVDEWRGENWRGDEAGIRLYQPLPPTGEERNAPTLVDPAGPLGNLYLAAGWSALPTADGVRYALRPTADLMLDLPRDGSTLAFDLTALTGPVTVSINGREVGTIAADPSGRASAVLHVPPGVADLPVDRMRLAFHDTGKPAVAVVDPPSAAGWPVGGTGITLAPDVALFSRSAGEEVGDFAEIRVRGADHAVNDRGYNLVALTTAGDILDTARFDTFSHADESARMAAWLAAWPEGTVVAGAAADEASYRLTEEAVAALAGIGVTGDLRDHFRWSHAFVGAVGSPPGGAVEQMALLRPAVVTVGAPINGETVYGGIGPITIAPDP